MAMAKGTAIPAVSNARKMTKVTKIWRSGLIAGAASPPRLRRRDPPHIGNDRPHHRMAQRRDSDEHRQAWDPQLRHQVGRRLVARVPRIQLEPADLPEQDAGER